MTKPREKIEIKSTGVEEKETTGKPKTGVVNGEAVKTEAVNPAGATTAVASAEVVRTETEKIVTGTTGDNNSAGSRAEVRATKVREIRAATQIPIATRRVKIRSEIINKPQKRANHQ